MEYCLNPLLEGRHKSDETGPPQWSGRLQADPCRSLSGKEGGKAAREQQPVGSLPRIWGLKWHCDSLRRGKAPCIGWRKEKGLEYTGLAVVHSNNCNLPSGRFPRLPAGARIREELPVRGKV